MWKINQLQELTPIEVYQLYKLRSDVFIVEQNCAYPEVDEIDLVAKHGLKYDEQGNLQAYFRVYEKNNTQYIGRVVVAPKYRQLGLGHELLAVAINACDISRDIRIEAQAHLAKFYQAHQFVIVSEPYDEDGILHISMMRSSK